MHTHAPPHNLQARYLKVPQVKLLAAALLALLLALPSVAHAAGTIDVNTFADEFGGDTDATCSLREAIEAVNIHNDFGGCTLNGTAPFTIQLAAGTYQLTLRRQR